MIRIYPYSQVSPEEIFQRQPQRPDVSAAVAGIIAAVRREGDAALRRYTLAFDHAAPAALEVSRGELDAKLAGIRCLSVFRLLN